MNSINISYVMEPLNNNVFFFFASLHVGLPCVNDIFVESLTLNLKVLEHLHGPKKFFM